MPVQRFVAHPRARRGGPGALARCILVMSFAQANAGQLQPRLRFHPRNGRTSRYFNYVPYRKLAPTAMLTTLRLTRLGLTRAVYFRRIAVEGWRYDTPRCRLASEGFCLNLYRSFTFQEECRS